MAVLTYSQIKEEIAYFLGSPIASWDAITSDAVESCIRTGIDRVIHNGVHQWTWMRPRWTVTTTAGQRTYNLSDDFEQFISDLYFDGVHYQYPPITQLPASRLLQLFTDEVSNGTPRWFATEPVAAAGSTNQVQQLVLHPTPDASYALYGVYQIAEVPLDVSHPYPPGGDAHGELFLASCIAEAEAKFIDAVADKKMRFQEMLSASIAIDLRRQARNLGPISGKRVPMRGRANLRRILDMESGYTTIKGSTNF